MMFKLNSYTTRCMKHENVSIESIDIKLKSTIIMIFKMISTKCISNTLSPYNKNNIIEMHLNFFPDLDFLTILSLYNLSISNM